VDVGGRGRKFGNGQGTDVTDQQAREIPDRGVVPARGWVVNAQGEVMLVANQVAGQLDDRTRPPVSVCVPR
jgi:hypothetical protein